MFMDKRAGESLAQFLEVLAPAAATPAMESGLKVTDGLPAPTGREREGQNQTPTPKVVSCHKLECIHKKS